MRLATWDPFTEMESVLNRYRPQAVKANTESISQADWHPSVDVSETEAAFHLHAELAGVKKEDIKIDVHENVLTLSGRKESKFEETKDKVHRVERLYGSFCRRFTLPDNVDAENVNASYQDGILDIEIPKSAEEKPKRFEISIN